MPNSCSPGLGVVIRLLPVVACTWVWVACTLAFAGWVLGNDPLKGVFISSPMIPLAGVYLLLLSLSLWLQREGTSVSSRRSASGIALLTILLSAALLGEYLFGWELGIDRWFFADQLPRLQMIYPGRPPLQGLLSALLLGSALVLRDERLSCRPWIPEALALGSLLPAFLALLGYVYQVSLLYRLPSHYGFPLITVLSLLMLGIGFLASRTERGIAALLLSYGPGGSLLRRLLLPFVIFPILMGWLRLWGEQQGYYEKDFGVTLMVAGIIGVALGLIGWSAYALNRLERDRLAVQAALCESEERYRRLVELSPEAIVVDHEGVLVYVNPAGVNLIGALRAEELIGRSFLDFLTPEAREDFSDKLARVKSVTQETVLFEQQLVRLNGSLMDVEFMASPVQYQGRAAAIIICRDVTARKKDRETLAVRNEELRQAVEMTRLKDHFLSALSHELKTPLSLIIGYLELLEDKYPEETLVAGIQEGSQRLTRHINNMLDYSALLSGDLPLYLSELDLSEVAQNLCAIIAAEQMLAERKFTCEVAPAIPLVRCDSRRLTQMLLELLDNARKFTPPGGTIGLRILPCGKEVRIDVWDTGEGIPEADRERIWEAFSRREMGDVLRHGGLGLGLTIVKKLAELLGGRVELQSQVGKGSCFSLFLPVETEARA